MKQEDFNRWFNGTFWRAFKDQAFPLTIPKSVADRKQLLDRVYRSVLSARYAPSPPEAEIVINKGHGVARTIPVFCIEDYCIYYFCIKELESVLCVNRTENTFGGWTLGGQLREQETSDIECELTEYGRYSFNPHAWVEAFGQWNSLLFSQLDARNYSHVLQFDLANFMIASAWTSSSVGYARKPTAERAGSFPSSSICSTSGTVATLGCTPNRLAFPKI